MTAVTKPRAACLIGWPAAHSRSPLIHHYWLRTLGIEGGYNIEAVPPEGFAEFVLHLSAHGFVGANVTIPHKERALALSKPDARARAVGAANTLWYEGGELRSTNTDIEGFINNLDACAPGWDAAVGSAGAGRRRVVARRGVRPDRARHQARASGKPHHRAGARAGGSIRRQRPSGRMGRHRRDWLPRAELLVNTTSLGMHGQPALETRRRPAAVACRRRRSRLCAAGNAVAGGGAGAGLKTADGLGMLLHQAVRGFELWFGRRPEVTPELRALVEADLTSA